MVNFIFNERTIVQRRIHLFLCAVLWSSVIFSQSISSFTLVDAVDNTDLLTLSDGAIINILELPNAQVNVRANVDNETVKSVIFYLDGVKHRTENLAPYALFGDTGGDYRPWTPPLRTVQIRAIPYTGFLGTGDEGAEKIINLNFVEIEADVIPNPPSNLRGSSSVAGEIQMEWNDNANNESGFEIETFEVGIDEWILLKTVEANITTYTDVSVGSLDMRSYRIRAITEDSASAYSNEIEISNFPFAPTNIFATSITSTGLTLNWTNAPFGEELILESAADENGPYAELQRIAWGTTEINLDGYTPETRVYFQLKTLYEGQTSKPSEILAIEFPVEGQSVTQLILIDADTDQDIGPIKDGDTINLLALSSQNLNVRAETNPAIVGSVTFDYNDNVNFRTESVAPYALAGDGGGDYRAWTPELGANTIRATPFSLSGMRGVEGISLSVGFTVVEEEIIIPPPPSEPVETVTGALKKWHKITLSFEGPNTSETANPNPFSDYRMDVTFTNGSTSYTIPGFYAADGNAANTSATAGNIWQCHFSPDKAGTWKYRVSFRSGADVAISDDLTAGDPTAFDGANGGFEIEESDKSGVDFRAKGRLEYVGEHYLKFADANEYFIKAGPDAPENTFSYLDFDATPNKGLRRKTWAPHAQDFFVDDAADYTWGEEQEDGARDKGRNLLGVIRYLADQGMNAFSFLTLSLDGDDGNVYPHLGINSGAIQWEDVYHDRFDVSKMMQWEQIMAYADKKGVFLHFKMMETENDQLMDDGDLGRERILYFRELIARYGHHLGLNWSLGEENTNTEEQQRDMLAYFQKTDPYQHLVVIHTFPDQQDQIYTPLLGEDSGLTGVSVQSWIANVHRDVKKWVEASAAAGKKWVVANDEQGNSQAGVSVDDDYPADLLPESNNVADNRKVTRGQALWATLLAGGSGVEYFYGYQTGCDDLDCEDHRTRESKWQDAKIALDFFRTHLSNHLVNMQSYDALTANEDDYVFADPGKIYVIYQSEHVDATIDLSDQTGSYIINWFSPSLGGDLINGSVQKIEGGSIASFGNPPNNLSEDWIVLIQRDFSDLTLSSQPNLNQDDFYIIYPNPVWDELFIDGLLGDTKAELLDINGRLVLQQQYQNSRAVLPLGNIPAGIYLLHLKNGGHSHTIRINKQ